METIGYHVVYGKLSVVCYPTRLQVDGELNTLLMRLPNLLDSRVPDGDGEEENLVVAEWGQEYIRSGEVLAGAAVDSIGLIAAGRCE